MAFRIAADVVVLIHFAFVLFVVFGGFLVIRRSRFAFLHLPVAIYGVVIEFVGFICPLTPLENWLRRRGGEAGYHGGFVEEYVMKILYPSGLTREMGITLGILVIVVNAVAYSIAIRRR